MKIANADARLEGIRLKNAKFCPYKSGISDSPGALWLENGTVTNCVFADNRGGRTKGGALYVKAGLVTDCLFYGNSSQQNSNGNVGQGGAIWIDGGIVEHCVISK